MGRETKAVRWGEIPRAFLGMIALVAVVEGAVGLHPVEFSNYMALSWRFAAEAAPGPGARAEVLGFGDSMVKFGVQPPVLERRLGRPAYNLAVYGGQAPATFFLFRRVIESGGRPKAVIVDFHSNLLDAAPVSVVPCWSEVVGVKDGMELAWWTLSPSLVARTVLARVLPTFNGRDEIRAAILAATAGRRDDGLDARRADRRNWLANGGGHANDSGYRAGGPIDVNPARPGRWVPRALHTSYVRRFLDLARANGVTVVWLIPPTHPDWQLRRERLQVDGPYTRFVREMTADRPGVVVVDGRHADYPAWALTDPTHLNARGATEVTEALAEILAPWLAGETGLPNWVDLPRYRGTDLDARVETISRSRQAVRIARDPGGGAKRF